MSEDLQEQHFIQASVFDDGSLSCTVIAGVSWNQIDKQSERPSSWRCAYEKCETRDTALEEGSAWRSNAAADVPESYLHGKCLTAARNEEEELKEKDLEIIAAADRMTGTVLSEIPDSVPEAGTLQAVSLQKGP